MTKGLLIALVLVSVVLLTGYVLMQTPPEKANNDKIQIAVSILPQTYVVNRIGGDKVEVKSIVPTGLSVETYDPTAQDMAYLSQADVLFTIGLLGFEKTKLQDLTSVNPELAIVNTAKNNTLRLLEAHDHDKEENHARDEVQAENISDQQELEHVDEDPEEHATEELDPHVWLAPLMVLEQAKIVNETLQELDPQNAAYFQTNFESLAADLIGLDNHLQEAFAPIRGKTMLVYHPAFGYLADAYGFTQEHFQIEGKEATLAQVKEIVDLAKKEDIRVIFVQKQFSTDSAQAIAEQIGGAVVAIDPLDPDYITNLNSIADTITTHLQ